MAPRMEQGRNLLSKRIYRGQIRPFLQVTAVAGQRQVVSLVRAAVLPGDNVLNVMR
jgi:hypothetical protein